MINKLNPYFENKYTLFLLKKYIYTVIVEFFLTKLTFIYRKILNLKKKIQFIKKLSFLYNKKLNLITVRENYKLHTEDFIKNLFLQFTEVSGDKSLMNDTAVIVGFGLIQRKSICVVGIEKGFSLNDKVRRNFGSAKPEGYRKILRTTILAEKFNLPVLFLIDTPGAYPGIESEERHISLTISNNIKNMGFLRVPTLSVVLSEGGSGGALSIGVTDYILMLQYSYYSVISPEGCSTILWKNCNFVEQAAEELKMYAINLKRFNIINFVIPEVLGGSSIEKNWPLLRAEIYVYYSLYLIHNNSLSRLVQLRNRNFRYIGYFSTL